MDGLKHIPQSVVKLYSIAFEYVDLSELRKPANDNLEQYSLPLGYANDNGQGD